MRIVVALFIVLSLGAALVRPAEADEACVRRHVIHRAYLDAACMSCLKEWAKNYPDGTKIFDIDGYLVEGSDGVWFSGASSVACFGSKIVIRDPINGNHRYTLAADASFLPNDWHQVVKPGETASPLLMRSLAARIAHLDYLVFDGKLKPVVRE